MKVRSQLLLAGVPLAVALIVVGVFAMRSIEYLERTSQAILAENYRSVLAAQRMKESLERIDDDAYFVATGHSEHGSAEMPIERRRFDNELRVGEGNITEAGEADVVRGLRARWDEYQLRLEECLAYGAGGEAQRCYFRELRPRFGALRADADRLLAVNQDAMALKGDRARREAERTGAAMAIAVAAALVLGIALSSWLTDRALRPLSALGQSVEQFGRGDFAVRAPVRGGAELAQLAATFNSMADRITEYQKSSLGEMLQAQLAAQATLDSLTDPVFVFAPNGDISSLNRAAEDLFPAGASSGFAASRLDPELREAVEHVRAHVLQGKGAFVPRSFDEAFAVMRADGERAYLPRAAPIYEEGGGIVGATVVLQDVTRLRRFEQLRDDLVATVAHQFRTPLTSLRMAIHLCLEEVAGPLSAKQQDLLYAAREECERLQEIVDELLDLARLQAGRIELAPEPIAAGQLVERALRAVRATAQAKGVALASDVVADFAVSADPQRIDLVFANLLENAIRHTPSGGRIALRAIERGDVVRFEVEDTGAGIPEAERARVFEKFYRGPGGSGGGAGIGLSLARDIVGAHGGAIGVESEVGRGSTFWFTLPLVAGDVAG